MGQTTTVKRTAMGYRLDGIRSDGRIGFYGAPDADPVRCPRLRDRPTIPGRPKGEEFGRWTPAAFCVSHAHISPAPDCVCGWRVSSELADLAGLPHGSGLDVSLRRNDDIADRPVVAEVSAWGPTLAGIPGDDPTSTVRTTWMRLHDRIWIRDDIPRDVVRKARRRYPYADVARFSDLDQLADQVDADTAPV